VTGAGSEMPGRYALYSATDRKRFTCTVECSSCREETRVSYLELGLLMFPVHFHLPFVRYHHSWFRCPACGQRTWLRIHLDR
jgi:hypothetical protein